MNKQSLEALDWIYHHGYISQRQLAEGTGNSLGIINRSLKELTNGGFVGNDYLITEKGRQYIENGRPQNAVILAAGLGMRMIPVNVEAPKGLLEAKGEALIERLICQLQEAGITKIHIVVGFMKEKFEYLIDRYQVQLIVNTEYAVKNNLHSLYLAREYLSNSYILPCDIYCKPNPFHTTEPYSWYMVTGKERDCMFRATSKRELVRVDKDSDGNRDIGIAYVRNPEALLLKENLIRMNDVHKYDACFWEEALFDQDRMVVTARIVNPDDYVEINTFEQLCDFDRDSGLLHTDAISMIEREFGITVNEIRNVKLLKKGLSNHSFLFTVHGEPCIMRIPEERAPCLLDRYREQEVYQIIQNCGIAEQVLAFNPKNGYRITKYFANSRSCNPNCEPDIQKCMSALKKLHQLAFQITYEFDIFSQIDYLESQWSSGESYYRDYIQTKENVFSLRPFLEEQKKNKCLCHIDPAYDNFLILHSATESSEIRLIDWEYAGMCDPDIDIAMFGVYAGYHRMQMDHLVDLYYPEGCSRETRIKIYAYISACGLFWSNWCEYKMGKGIEFGEYSLRQYRYAKEYYRIARSEINTIHDSRKEKRMTKQEFEEPVRKKQIYGAKQEPKLTEQEFEELLEEVRLRHSPEAETKLKPYKVDNAIIMAAGMSSRFVPLSYEIPKGLLKVKGEILIEREIRQLLEAGITDITVVTGYMHEKFEYLKEMFGVSILVNQDYRKYNNTSTLIRVTDKMRNTYICSSDNYFERNVFEPYVYRSYYSAVFTEGETDEYCLSCNEEGRITQVSIGGSNSWYMLGHVYFDKEFSERFVRILETEYENPTTKEQLWENLYIRYIQELDLYIRKYPFDAVKEFDSLEELRSFDEDYMECPDSLIFRNICQTLKCRGSDISNLVPVKSGLTNLSFRFTVDGEEYIYRHPGVGTETFINRRSEAYSMEIARKSGLDHTFIAMSAEQGWKLSHYVPDVRELDYHRTEDVEKAIQMIHTLHSGNWQSEFDFDIWARTMEFDRKLRELGCVRDMGNGSLAGDERNIEAEAYGRLLQKMQSVNAFVMADKWKHCLCHCDCYAPNFIIGMDGRMSLIDWEYSGNDDPASDLGTFICCSDYSYEEAVQVLDLYLGHPASEIELRHHLGYIAIASYYWYLWALYLKYLGNDVGEYLNLWHCNAREYAERTLHLYEEEYDETAINETANNGTAIH